MKVPAFTVSRLLPQRLDGPPRRLLGDAGNSRINEATGAVVTNQKSLAPRPDYQAGDKVMQVITCQL
jgi:hypothetical protein